MSRRLKRGQLIPRGHRLITKPHLRHGQTPATAARRYRNWGLHRPIRPRTIIRFRWRGHRTAQIQQIEDAMGVTFQYFVADVIKIAIGRALDQFDTETRPGSTGHGIPVRTGALRNDILRTFRNSLFNMRYFPLELDMGAPNVDWASVVQRYNKAHIQMEHAGGIVWSGKHNPYRYDSGLGDPDAQYRPFTTYVKPRIIRLVRDHLDLELARYNISKTLFNQMVWFQIVPWVTP